MRDLIIALLYFVGDLIWHYGFDIRLFFVLLALDSIEFELLRIRENLKKVKG